MDNQILLDPWLNEPKLPMEEEDFEIEVKWMSAKDWIKDNCFGIHNFSNMLKKLLIQEDLSSFMHGEVIDSRRPFLLSHMAWYV